MSVFSTRKILCGLLLLTVGIAITVIKGDIPSGLLSLMQSLYYAFVMGNGAEHLSNIMIANKNGQ